MSRKTFDELDQLTEADGPEAAIEKLLEDIRSRKDYHKLFDALLLKKKFEMGLPLTQPTSFDDVPDDRREEFEKSYVEAARKVGQLLLDANQIPDAWIYFRTIREPEAVARAIDAIDTRRDADDETEALINVALYEGANPVKGLEMMLRTHGTCNTVTAMDQQLGQFDEEDRQKAAGLLVRELHQDLSSTVRQEVEKRMAMVPPGDSLGEMIAGRDWLFEEGNYHIDVSHLSAVVRFARALDASSPELPLAIELAEYGSKLDPQFQYQGDPPFQDFYTSHLMFLRAISGEAVDEAIEYFREILGEEPDYPDKQMIAYVMVDLLKRINRLEEALELAGEFLKDVEEAGGFSFARLCQQAGRMDALREAAREKGDLVSYMAAIIQDQAGAVSA